MPWNGSGVFQRTDGTRSGATVWQQAKAAGVKIREDHHDTHDEDIAGGIEACLNRDGENSPTTNINWGGFKITNLAAGSVAGDAVAYDQSGVRFTSTTAGASAGPTLTLYRNNTAAADNALGLIEFQGKDSAGNQELYASIFAEIADHTSASEDARIKFNAKVEGTERTVFRLTAGGTSQLSSYEDGATVGPVLTLHRDSSSPADADVIGGINFDGEDDGSTQTTYARIAAVMDDVTNATEDGHIKVQCVRAGSLITATAPGVLQGLTALTSSTAASFTIHSDARRITVLLLGLSTNGTNILQIRLGDAGGIETAGYLCNVASITGTSASEAPITNGFALNGGSVAAETYSGQIVMTLADPATNTWIASGTLYVVSSGVTISTIYLSGSRALDSVLTTVQLTADGNTFDAGSINLLVE